MPVILDEKDWDLWLDPATPPKELQALMRPAPDDLLEAVPVSDAVNRVANDHAGLVIEIDARAAAVAETRTAAIRRKPKPTDDRQNELF
jgi:putative SOS response-associated peptidase YedK